MSFFHRICLVEQVVSVFEMNDVRSYFGSSSKPSTSVSTSRQSSSSSEDESEVPPTKKPCVRKPEQSKKRSHCK